MINNDTTTTYQIVLGRQIKCLDRQVTYSELDIFIREEIVSRFSSFTVSYCEGYWKGERENVCVITILSQDYYDGININRIAEIYKKRFFQDAVLVNTFACIPNLV